MCEKSSSEILRDIIRSSHPSEDIYEFCNYEINVILRFNLLIGLFKDNVVLCVFSGNNNSFERPTVYLFWQLQFVNTYL